MQLSPIALSLIAEAFGPQSKGSVSISLAPVVIEIQQWLDSQASSLPSHTNPKTTEI